MSPLRRVATGISVGILGLAGLVALRSVSLRGSANEAVDPPAGGEHRAGAGEVGPPAGLVLPDSRPASREALVGPPSGATTSRVVVLGPEGAALEGAEVFVVDPREARQDLGATDARGALAVELEPLAARGARIAATCDGHAPASRTVEPGLSVLTLHLGLGQQLRGQLRFAGAPLPRAGLRVLAEDPDSLRVSAERALDAEDPELRHLSATTDASGRFCILGARADRSYWVYAGGQGDYSRQPAAAGPDAERAALQVDVERVFGALVRFVHADGSDATLPAGGRWPR